MWPAVVGVVVCVAGLAGCAGERSAPMVSGSSGASVSSDPSRGEGVWLSVSRSGGVAGEYSTVVVLQNGRVVTGDKDYSSDSGMSLSASSQSAPPQVSLVPSPSSVWLSKPELDKLRESVKGVDWTTLAEQSFSPECCDMFEYTVIVDGESVSFSEAQVPAGVGEVLSQVGRFL